MKMIKAQTISGAWLIALIALLTVTLVYILFDQMFQHTLYDIAIAQNVDSSVLGIIVTSWKVYPILFIGGLFLYAIANSGRETFEQRRVI